MFLTLQHLYLVREQFPILRLGQYHKEPVGNAPPVPVSDYLPRIFKSGLDHLTNSIYDADYPLPILLIKPLY
jgi:hypothetical protein